MLLLGEPEENMREKSHIVHIIKIPIQFVCGHLFRVGL